MTVMEGMPDWRPVAGQLREITVAVRGRGPGGGSGVIWRPDGLIVTNAHVVREAEVQVELADGRIFPAEVTALDRRRDLASLQVQAIGLPGATVRDSTGLQVGELVLAVGNPLGLKGALTSGIIQALDPEGAWVRAALRLAPGNSGGPLADATGRVVGINAMVAGGLGLAVPSNAVQRFLARQAGRRQLGLTVRPVTISRRGEPVVGLLVLEVAPGSPAAEAGLLIGDVLLGASGHLFRQPCDLADLLAGAGPELALDISRGGIPLGVSIPLQPVTEAA